MNCGVCCRIAVSVVGMWDILGLAGEMELDSLLDMYCCYYLVDIFSLVFSTELCVSESLWIETCAMCRAAPGWVLLPWCLVLKVWCLSQFPFILGYCSGHIHLNWLWNQTVVPGLFTHFTSGANFNLCAATRLTINVKPIGCKTLLGLIWIKLGVLGWC